MRYFGPMNDFITLAEIEQHNRARSIITGDVILNGQILTPIFESVYYFEIINECLDRNQYAGIYFLTKNNKVIYVGMSLCLKSRLKYHYKLGLIPFDGVGFIRQELPHSLPKPELTKMKSELTQTLFDIEQKLIEYFEPALNRKHFGG